MPEPATPAPDTIRAPWTFEQVEALDRFQHHGGMHPFTCGGGHHGYRSPVLNATQTGWACPDPTCDYQQDWALAFMANPDAWPKPLLGRTTTPAPPTAPPSCAGCIACGGPDCIERPEPDAPTELGTPAASPNETGAGFGACVCGRSPDPGVCPGGHCKCACAVMTPAPSTTRDTMREAIAGALAQTDDICGMDHGFTDPCIDIIPDAVIDAVMAVRDGEMQQLRAKVRRLTSDLAETAGLEETAADRYQNALHWQERAEEAEATIDRVRDTLPFADQVIATSGPGPASAVQAVLDRLRTALTAPHGPAGHGGGM